MSINKYDNYQPFDYPIEAMLKMGQISEQRADRSNDALDKFQAALSSINPAPGHEDYAKDVIGKYYSQAQELVDSGIKPNDPRFMSGVRKMTYKLANDQDVKTINNSKKYYDEIISKTLPEVINKAGIAEMEGVLQNNNFIPNRRNYDNFRFYTGDYVAEADAYLKNVQEEVKQNPSNFGGFIYKSKGANDPNKDLDGILVTFTGQGNVRKWRDDDTFEIARQRLTHDWTTDPSATGARQLFSRRYGMDPDRINQFFKDRSAQFFMNQRLKGQRNYDIHVPDGPGDEGGLLNMPQTPTGIDVNEVTDQTASKILKGNLFKEGMFVKKEYDISGKNYNSAANKRTTSPGVIAPGVQQSKQPVSKEEYVLGQQELQEQQEMALQQLKHYRQLGINYDSNGRPLKDKEVLERYQEAINNMANQKNYKYDPAPAELAKIQETLIGEGNGDITSAAITGPGFKQVSFEEAANKLGISATSAEDIKSWKVTGISAHGPTGLEYSVKARKGDGTPVTLSVSGSFQMQNATAVSNALVQQLLSGSLSGRTKTASGDIIGYKAYYDPESRSFIPKYYTIDSETGEVDLNVNLEDIREAELKQLTPFYKLRRNSSNKSNN